VTVSTVIPGAFHTSNTDMETVWNELRSKWRNVPDEIRLNYDIKYLENGNVRYYRQNRN